MKIVCYIIVGLVFLIFSACAVIPLVLDKMSKEERDAASIVQKEDN